MPVGDWGLNSRVCESSVLKGGFKLSKISNDQLADEFGGGRYRAPAQNRRVVSNGTRLRFQQR